MALDERYFLSAPLNQYFVDKDSGLPLANGTLTFYRDIARNTPKSVYQLSGTPPDYSYTALPNPVTLSSVGTIQNAGGDNVELYLYPYDSEGNLDLYYIVCRNENGIEQWTREGFPNVSAENDPTIDKFPVENQLANPQFSKVFLNNGLTTTYTVSATTTRFSLAPDWDIEVTSAGAGSVAVSRTAIQGNSQVITSPPYVLDVNVASGTTVKIIQKLNTNSGLWASTSNQEIYLSTTLVGQNEGAGTASISMYYRESTGGSPVEILTGALTTGGYVQIKSGSDDPIPNSSNTDSGTDGYVEIYVEIEPSTHVSFTSLQVVPTLSSSGRDLVQYDNKSSNREQALMGDYFIPNLEKRRQESILTGWDFALNPAQFGETQTLGATAAYVWDQTIGLRLLGSVGVSRDTRSGGIKFTTSSALEDFYIMQYLTGSEVKKVISNKLCSNIVAYKGSVGDDVTMRVYMYRSIANYTDCRLASTTNLAGTYANGTLGVGATLTQTTGMSALSVDGIAVAANNRILVRSQTNTFENGIYTVTNAGSGAQKWVLTRATDYDTAAEMIPGALFYISAGSTLVNNTYAQTNTINTVGTDAVAFSVSASVPLLPASIGSLATGGVFSLNTTVGQGLNWTEISRNGLGTATATLPTVTTGSDLNNALDIQFSEWQITDATQINDTDKFAIVVTFNVPTDLTEITVDSITVNTGSLPSRPAPKSKSEVLFDCQRYYTKSFFPETAPAQALGAGTGEYVWTVSLTGVSATNYSPSINFVNAMRQRPTTPVTYNPLAPNAFVRDYNAGDATATSLLFVTKRGFTISCSATLGFAAGNPLAVHWSADARLGII